jgi:hypothetical protein
MKYFIDTEFIEGFHKPIGGKRRHHIDLISIGIHTEDGRDYYAVSLDFDAHDANEWVRNNVLTKLPDRHLNGTNVQEVKLWKLNSQIKNNIIDFIGNDPDPRFYAYFADYDWVAFCSLFGTMMDLPKRFPMYCRDVKQIVDEFVEEEWLPGSIDYMQGTGVEVNFKTALEAFKRIPEYPTQENEHTALDDAKWTYRLYCFVQSLRTNFKHKP